MRILFISRKFPPSVGGMETAAVSLYEELARHHAVDIVKYGGPNLFLPIVYPVLFLKAWWLCWRHKYDGIYLQDGLMAPIGALLKFFTKYPTVVTVHGLELNYAGWLYRNVAWTALIRPTLAYCDLVVAVSAATKHAVQKHLPIKSVEVVSNGISDVFYSPLGRDELLNELAKDIPGATNWQNKQVLLTVGRLIKRKGVAWFLNNVFLRLATDTQDVVYLITSEGPERQRIRSIIKQHKLEKQVFLLGAITDKQRALLYNLASVFVMPNIPVADDMEGFGLVAVEASSCGTPVVAADLQGIPDAVINGKTGYLVEAKNPAAFLAAIKKTLEGKALSPESIRKATIQNYSWQQTAKAYALLIANYTRKT